MDDQQAPTVDRISDLPWDILDNILGKLPIRTVVSTSILSRKWRYRWIDISKLLFVLEFWNEEGHCYTSDEISKMVCQVLLSHRGAKINKFLFQTDGTFYRSFDNFDCWIHLLARKGIKDLAFKFNERIPEYELPARLFSCQTLNHLYLSYCEVVIPDPKMSECFGNLVSLELVDFSVCDDESLESLTHGCPVLERLVLMRFTNNEVECLKIHAPRLKYLYVEGRFRDIYIAKCPLLDDVCFKLTYNATSESVQGMMAHNLVGPLWCLSHVRKLALSGHFLKFLAKRHLSEGISFECNQLLVLELSDVHFDEFDEISLVLSFLSSFSSLREFCFSAAGPFTEDVCELMKAQLTCCFNKLRDVKIEFKYSCSIFDYYTETEEEESEHLRPDLKFVKLLLAHSPVLEKMSLTTFQPDRCDLWFMSKLLSFQRASSVLHFKYSSRWD